MSRGQNRVFSAAPWLAAWLFVPRIAGFVKRDVSRKRAPRRKKGAGDPAVKPQGDVWSSHRVTLLLASTSCCDLIAASTGLSLGASRRAPARQENALVSTVPSRRPMKTVGGLRVKKPFPTTPGTWLISRSIASGSTGAAKSASSMRFP